MKAYKFGSVILSLFMAAAVLPGNLQAADLIDHTSNIFKFQQKLANKGNAHAQFRLASMYESGDGIDVDIDQAKHWYTQASKAGSHPAAQRSSYLNIKENGFDAARDTVWLSGVKADADMHKADAIFLLGQLYQQGIGVKKDLTKSLALFKQIKSMGEANVSKEIASINQELAASRIAEKKRQQQRLLANKTAEQAELSKKEAGEKLQKSAADKAKQMAAKAQLVKAEKRRKYEAVMLKLKLEQQMIDEQQSQVNGGGVASIDDEI